MDKRVMPGGGAIECFIIKTLDDVISGRCILLLLHRNVDVLRDKRVLPGGGAIVCVIIKTLDDVISGRCIPLLLHRLVDVLRDERVQRLS